MKTIYIWTREFQILIFEFRPNNLYLCLVIVMKAILTFKVVLYCAYTYCIIYSGSEVSESLSADVWQHCAQVTPAVYHGPRWLIIQNRGEEWPGTRLTLDCVRALSGVRVTAGLGLLKLRFWPTKASTVGLWDLYKGCKEL